jgi:hypothetical protein
VALISLMVILGAEPLAAARSELSSGCTRRFEAARGELIRRGFAPTGDRDTRRWLQFEEQRFALKLGLEMRASADGPATSYSLWVERSRVGHEGTFWRHGRRAVPRGEHAATEDHLVNLWWTRSKGSLTAKISIVEFDSAGEDAEAKTWREMFTEVAQAAADDCLSGKPGAAAKVVPAPPLSRTSPAR